MTTTNTTYQGWTNYETWSVNLWIDNDEYNQDYLHEEAMEAYLNAEATEYSTRHYVAAVDLAEQIKDQYEESMPELDGSYGQTPLNASLFEVNWIEIAERMIDDIKDEVDKKNAMTKIPQNPLSVIWSPLTMSISTNMACPKVWSSQSMRTLKNP